MKTDVTMTWRGPLDVSKLALQIGWLLIGLGLWIQLLTIVLRPGDQLLAAFIHGSLSMGLGHLLARTIRTVQR